MFYLARVYIDINEGGELIFNLIEKFNDEFVGAVLMSQDVKHTEIGVFLEQRPFLIGDDVTSDEALNRILYILEDFEGKDFTPYTNVVISTIDWVDLLKWEGNEYAASRG